MSPAFFSQPTRTLKHVAALIVAMAVAVVASVNLSLGPVDDAFISLRYAANWASGHGLVFNLGEKVEGYTNFLTVVLEALLIRLGVEPLAAMLVLSWAGFAMLAAATLVLFDRALSNAPRIGRLLGVLAVLNSSLICWAGSGMETCLYAGLVLLALLALDSKSPKSRPIVLGVLLSLAAMARPEGIALVPVFAIFLFGRDRSLGEVARFALVTTILYGTYFLGRWAHFGYLLPNTFYAKLDYGNLQLASRGLSYLADFTFTAAPLVLVAAAAVAFVPSSPPWVRGALAIVTVQMALVVYEGGDHFPMYRFLAPSIPLLSALAVYSVSRIIELTAGGARRLLIVTSSAALFLLASLGMALGRSADYENPSSNFERFELECKMTEEWSTMGKWLAAYTSEESSIGTVAVGAIGFYSNRRIVDPHGIVNPLIAHKEIPLGRGYAGHEKLDIELFLGSHPDFVVLLNWLTHRPYRPDEVPSNIWGTFNKTLEANTRFQAMYLLRSFEIGPGRYLNLHVSTDLLRAH